MYTCNTRDPRKCGAKSPGSWNHEDSSDYLSVLLRYLFGAPGWRMADGPIHAGIAVVLSASTGLLASRTMSRKQRNDSRIRLIQLCQIQHRLSVGRVRIHIGTEAQKQGN